MIQFQLHRSIAELWINGKLTDYAQAATKQNKIVAGCASSETEETFPEPIKKKASSLKKDSGLREVKDSAAQPQSYVSNSPPTFSVSFLSVGQ